MSVLAQKAHAAGVAAARDYADRGMMRPPVMFTAPDSLTRVLKVQVGTAGPAIDTTAEETAVVRAAWEAGVSETWARRFDGSRN